MLGGLVRGDVTVQTATQEATQGEVAGAALRAYRTQHTNQVRSGQWRHPSTVYYRTLPVDEASDEADVNGE